jgi:hypothetical protein
VGIVIKDIVPSIRRPSPINIAPKDMDDAMLNLFSDFDQVHILPAPGGALDLMATVFSG